METTQNTDTVAASSKCRSHTPNRALLKATSTVLAQKLIGWKKPALRISLMAPRNAPHFVPGPHVSQLQDRTERETNTKTGKILSKEVIPRNLAKTEKTCELRSINQKSCLSVRDFNHNSVVFEVVGDVNSLLKQIRWILAMKRMEHFMTRLKVWTYEFLKYSVCSFILGHQVKTSMKI